jgi:hypothetical protein
VAKLRDKLKELHEDIRFVEEVCQLHSKLPACKTSAGLV